LPRGNQWVLLILILISIEICSSASFALNMDRKDHTSLEYKLDTFSSAYKKLTGKDVLFEFPVVVSGN
jgi:small subunit ribosomal protein S7e